MAESVIVIGGGVAGIAAAVRLAEEGRAVTVYERRSSLGGRASSFVDHETGERVDNCQHITMRCCTNLEDLYRRLGVSSRIRYLDAHVFLARDGRTSVIAGGLLPAPLHALPSFARFGALGARDKAAVARGLISILHTPVAQELDAISMAEWAARTRQTRRAIDHFWRTILVSACNADLEDVSCLTAFKVFRDGFLANAAASHMGIPTVRLADLYTEPAVRFLEDHGARVHFGRHADRLQVADGLVRGTVLSDGSTVTADAYVSAVPFDQLLGLLPPGVADAEPYFARLRGLRFAPITGVHLWFDQVLDAPEAVALLDRPTQWIFNKTRSYAYSCAPQEGTYLGLVVSAAQRYIDTPKEHLVEMALRDVHQCVPGSARAKLLKSYVIKERKATFVPAPGTEALRPDQRSPIPNLFIAGDWTQTGWPATMESAARSGYMAVERLLESAGIRKRLLAPDLPRGIIARWLMPA